MPQGWEIRRSLPAISIPMSILSNLHGSNAVGRGGGKPWRVFDIYLASLALELKPSQCNHRS